MYEGSLAGSYSASGWQGSSAFESPNFRSWEGSVHSPLEPSPKKSILRNNQNPLEHEKSVRITTASPPVQEQQADDDNSDHAVPTNTDNESIDSDDSLEPIVPEWPSWRNRCRDTVLYNSWFERFWLLVIILNCVTLAIEDPTDVDCVSSVCKFTTVTGNIFSFLFAVECGMKISGLGFYKRRGAYLKDEWNVLDFIIVISGLASFVAELFMGSGNSAALTGLRAFRLLRPLKAVQAFPAVRVLVQSILASLPQLLDVFVLYFFFVLTMGIIAVQQWKGLLGYRCLKDDLANVTTPISTRLEPEDRVCKNGFWEWGGHRCPWGYNCTDLAMNPNNGKLSFNHIGVTGLTLFTGLTLEGWTDSMYYTMDATTYVASLYWVLLVIFGSFFVLNLTIVIITEAFEKKQQEQKTAAFFAIDKDGTGELDRDEVRLLLKKRYNREITEEELDDAFEAMDEDGGGTISLGEFLAYTQNQSGLINKKSAMSGLGEDLQKLAKKMPGYDAAHAFYTKSKEMFEKATKEPEVRSKPKEFCYQLVIDDDSTIPVINGAFRKSVLLAILLNTIALAVEFYGQPKLMTDILYVFNIIFTIVFTLEAALKLYGLGVKTYFADGFNTFDLLIVVLSLIDLLFIRGGANVSIFRTFRVLRVLKLAKAFPTLQRWIQIVIGSIKGAAILTALLGLVVFIIALIGMQIFGGKFCFLDDNWDPSAWFVTPNMLKKGASCGGKPRSNYDDLGSAILTTFQILTGEDWNQVMYTGMVAVGDWVCGYFVLYYIIGNYLMLNLFIAVLLNNRELKESGEDELDDIDSETQLTTPEPEPKPRRSPVFLHRFIDSKRSMFIFSEQNSFRYWMYRIVESWPFELIVFVCILISTIFLAMENPRRPEDHPTSLLLNDANFVMIWVFLLEAIMKAVGYGFVLHSSSYLRKEIWNRLDFFIVCVSLASLVLPGSEGFAFIKIMRTLRPLRLINKSPGMKVVVQALFTSVGPLLNVLLISFLVWLIFGIMGVQVFKGAFYRCSDTTFGDVELAYPNITSKELCLNNCPVARCRWMNYSSHFNNLPVALVTLFEMASLEGWVNVMYLGMDHVEPDQSPRENYNKFWAAYFLAFIVFGSFFIINMFIGVLIDTYYQEKEKAAKGGGQLFLNEKQKQWVSQHRKMLNAMRTVDDPDTLIVIPQMRFVNARWFDGLISLCIVCNIIVMAMEYYGSSSAYDSMLEVANIFFITIFTLEAILKLLAMGPRNYMSQMWNRFDFLIVVLSLLGLIMAYIVKVDSVVSVFRILRLARLLRMVKKAKGIKRILNTLALSIFSLVNVAGILFLLLFVYATLGVKLFAKVKRGDSMGQYANFENFLNAMLLLLRMSTGEAWQAVSSDLRVTEPDCDPHLDECGRPYIATIYFCSYTMAGMYVLLNLFIAVILDNFSEAADMEEGETVTQEYIDLMHAAWDARAIDVDGQKVLTEATFQDYLREVGPPLGPSPNATLRKVQYFIVSLDAHHDSRGHLHKDEIFLKLFKKAYGESLPPEMEESLDAQFMKVIDERGGMARSTAGDLEDDSLSRRVAGLRVQALMKAWLARRRVTQLKAELRHPLIPPSANYTSGMVPEEVKEIVVKLPSGETWKSDPKFRVTNPPRHPSRRDLDPILRNYYENWNTLTPQQQQYYMDNHNRVFDHDPHTSSAYVAFETSNAEEAGHSYTL
eukprot:TRINITY_DN4146_c1_g1_i1.p1 TRINITY_DN4146_c1_g1~~TRINITY_DN4146_c1_g1_i1.p1  ORF type:complete len:1687 (+),score=370.93 TRINITY_DN4146_c1_g1_i1:73-5133(+)